jgi:hypothetical protein
LTLAAPQLNYATPDPVADWRAWMPRAAAVIGAVYLSLGATQLAEFPAWVRAAWSMETLWGVSRFIAPAMIAVAGLTLVLGRGSRAAVIISTSAIIAAVLLSHGMRLHAQWSAISAFPLNAWVGQLPWTAISIVPTMTLLALIVARASTPWRWLFAGAALQFVCWQGSILIQAGAQRIQLRGIQEYSPEYAVLMVSAFMGAVTMGVGAFGKQLRVAAALGFVSSSCILLTIFYVARSFFTALGFIRAIGIIGENVVVLICPVILLGSWKLLPRRSQG